MPTFDFSNIVRHFISGILATTRSPVVIVLAIGPTFIAIFGLITGWFDSISLNIPSISLTVDHNDVLSYLLYLINFEMFVDLINMTMAIIVGFMNLLVSIIISYAAVLTVFIVQRTIRRSLLDLKS